MGSSKKGTLASPVSESLFIVTLSTAWNEKFLKDYDVLVHIKGKCIS